MTFDYVIVGSGSAGAVIAERLSADGKATVLVVEAGGSDRRFMIRMPLGFAQCVNDPAVNWNFHAEPEPGLNDRVNHWPRGKVLGGSSSINALVWNRGHPSDFADWRAAGNVGWDYADVLPAFKAMESCDSGSENLHSADGRVHVSGMTEAVHPLAHRLIQAAVELGLPYNPDFNGAEQEGVGIYQQNIHRGRRVSAVDAYLGPAMRRSNVHVLTHALATRIDIRDGRAVGVELLQNGKRVNANARCEVIVSAGSIGSPQLLQLSGVGPGGVLSGAGVPVVVENDHVGANLQDHQGVSYAWRSRVETWNRLLGTWWGKAYVGSRYLLTRTGPLAVSVNHCGGFFRSDPSFSRPNLQFYFQPTSAMADKNGTRRIDPWPGFSMVIANCRPRSRGTVQIRSGNPAEAPRITVNALSDDGDVAEMLAGVRFLRKIAATRPLASIVVDEMRPGRALSTDEELVADIRARAGTTYHPVSSCRMSGDPAQGAVTPRLKVHGIDRLRVADASVFPSIVAGNTNAAAMMVGWKAAEIIAADNR